MFEILTLQRNLIKIQVGGLIGGAVGKAAGAATGAAIHSSNPREGGVIGGCYSCDSVCWICLPRNH